MICTLSGWKGLKKFISRDSLNALLIYIVFSMTVHSLALGGENSARYLKWTAVYSGLKKIKIKKKISVLKGL